MFNIADGRECFYQWDLNRQIIVTDSTISEVHFCNKTDDCSLVVEVKANPTDSELYADVPNILLQNDFPIRVYAYCKDGYTKIEKTFKVITRTKPDDYVYTETEVKRWEDLANEIDAKIEKLDEVVDTVHSYDAVIAETNNKIDNHERRITQVEKHINPKYFITDTSTAYEKPVPADACPTATIDTIGGMTYKVAHGNNYMTDLYIQTDDTSSAVINADGSITITNSDGGWHYAEIGFDSSAFSGKYFTAIGDTSGIDNLSIATQYWNDEDYLEDSHSDWNWYIPENEESRGYMEIYLDGVAGTFTFKPLIVDSPADAKPRLIDTDVEALESIGANLWDASWEKGELDVNTGREANVSTAIRSGFIKVEPNVIYTVRRSIAGNYIKVRYYDKNKNFVASGSASVHLITRGSSNQSNPMSAANFSYSFKVLLSNIAYMRIVDTTNDLSTVYSMYLGEYAEEDIPTYKPYRKDAIDTFTVPEELRAFLEQYGYSRGVEGYPNYIDFERKVFVQNTYRKVFDGTEDWFAQQCATTYGGGYRNMVYINPKPIGLGNTIVSPMVCNMYNADTPENTYYAKNGTCSCNSQVFHFYDNAYNTLDTSSWKAHLAELYADGTPLIAEYALAEPIEIDISAYLTDENIIEVEAGGYIRAVNKDKNPAYTSISYLLRESD